MKKSELRQMIKEEIELIINENSKSKKLGSWWETPTRYAAKNLNGVVDYWLKTGPSLANAKKYAIEFSKDKSRTKEDHVKLVAARNGGK